MSSLLIRPTHELFGFDICRKWRKEKRTVVLPHCLWSGGDGTDLVYAKRTPEKDFNALWEKGNGVTMRMWKTLFGMLIKCNYLF